MLRVRVTSTVFSVIPVFATRSSPSSSATLPALPTHFLHFIVTQIHLSRKQLGGRSQAEA